MGGKKPLRRPLWPPTRATASNYYPLGLDGAGGAAKPLLRAPKKPAPLHGRLPAFSGAVDAFERARKCFLEWRYFFSIILSEFLKNRVALQWDFTYLGIDDSEAGIVGKKVVLGQGDYRRVVEWNALRKAINNELLTYKVNEDKLMGPYFISKKNLPEGEMIDPAVFTRIFKNKVIMYLFDDAAKQKRITLFGGCDEKAKNQYSKICREFDTKGVYIFCEGISSQFIDNVPEDDGE